MARSNNPTRPASRLFVLLLSLALVTMIAAACAPKAEPDWIDQNAMGAIRRLTLVEYDAEDHVVLKEADSDISNDDFGSDWVDPLMTRDAQAFLNKMSTQSMSWQLTVVDSAVLQDARYSEAIMSPDAVQASVLAELARSADCDGLLWLDREYRIRGIKSPLGDKDHAWTAEVASHISVYAADGQRALEVNWINESGSLEGPSLQGSDAFSLLSTAVDQAASTTVTILTETTAGKPIPDGLRRERTEAKQEQTNALAEGGIWVRGGIVIALLVFGFGALGKLGEVSTPIKMLLILAAIVTLGTMVYLLIGRGWWKDTILAVLKLIEAAVFG